MIYFLQIVGSNACQVFVIEYRPCRVLGSATYEYERNPNGSSDHTKFVLQQRFVDLFVA